MKPTPAQKAEYRQMIRELTDKLNTEMLELKEALEWNLVIEEIAYLLSYTVSGETKTGYLITFAKNIHSFDIDDDSLSLGEVTDISEIEKICPQVHVALEMVDEMYGKFVN